MGALRWFTTRFMGANERMTLWFRFYYETVNDPKVLRLSDDLYPAGFGVKLYAFQILAVIFQAMPWHLLVLRPRSVDLLDIFTVLGLA